MSTQTTNLGLVKPDTNDFYDVAVQNSNMDKIDKYNSLRHPPQWLRSGTIEEFIIERYGEGFRGGTILISDAVHTPSDLPTNSKWVSIEWGRQPSAWIHMMAHLDGLGEIYYKQFVAISGDGRRTNWFKLSTSSVSNG